MRQALIVILFFGSIQSWALSNEVVLGALRQSTAERVSSQNRTPPRPGIGFGIKTESFSFGNFSIKLGLMYEQRVITDLFVGTEYNLELKTIDLETHLAYNFNDTFSIFAGPDYAVLLSSVCRPVAGPCQLSEDAKKYFVPFVLGLDLTFIENFGAEVFYEYISQEVWEKTFEKSQTYGLNLKYKF